MLLARAFSRWRCSRSRLRGHADGARVGARATIRFGSRKASRSCTRSGAPRWTRPVWSPRRVSRLRIARARDRAAVRRGPSHAHRRPSRGGSAARSAGAPSAPL